LIKSGLVAIREVRAWCDAQHAGLVRWLRSVDSFPEQAVAAASKTSLGQAAKTTERSTTLHATPKLADALGDGAITAEHIDAVTRASKKLHGAKRDEFVDRADALAEVAKAGTVDEFARRLDLEAANSKTATAWTASNANAATHAHGQGWILTACGT